MKHHLFISLMLAVTFQLQAQKEQALNEVAVVASRTVNTTDGYVSSLQGADITKGKPVVDVLGMLPGISREGGGFKINGLAVSEIYIDGNKLSDKSELDNIPGEMIDKIQVRYLAGSNQSSAHSGGTIMITLRRPPEGGYYGSVNVDAGWHRTCNFANGGVGGMFNYRYKGFSLYDNIRFSADKYRETSTQEVFIGNGYLFSDEESRWNGLDFRNRLSVSSQFSTGATLGGGYYVGTNRLNQKSVTVGEKSVRSSVENRDNAIAQEATVKFTMPLNGNGASMELAADYFNRHNTGKSSYCIDGGNVASNKEKTNLDLWKFSVGFTYPHSRKFTWQFGASAQYIYSHYDPIEHADNDRFHTTGIPASTNGFTPIIYASTKGMVWKLRYNIGLNWQLNRIGYHDLDMDKKSHNTQWALNPTIQVMMPFGYRRQHALMLNYRRTMGDIPYTAISPIVSWTDACNYSVGNPELKAQTGDILMAGLSLFMNRLNITMLYAHSHDRIHWQTLQDAHNPEVFYTKPVNINGQGMWGLGVEWIGTPVKWWRFKLSGRIEITPEDITLSGVHYGKTRFREYFYINNNVTFPGGWGGMLNANLEPTYRNYDRTYHAVYNIGGRIYKTFMAECLQVGIDFTAFGNRRKLDRRQGENTISYKYTTPVQYVGLSVVWNFSGGKKVEVDIVEGIQGYRETKDNR